LDLRDQIRSLRGATLAPFCVNLILAFDQRDRVEIAVREGAPWISFSWGLQPELVERVKAGNVRVMVQITSVPEARAAVAAGADALVVQGVEAGGHVQGTIGLLPLIVEVRDAVTIPLVAAGGIADPGSAQVLLAAGADAIAMGTRFVASDESLAHPVYRQRLIEATAADAVLTDLFDVGWPAPHRVLRNHVYEAWEAAGRPPRGQRPLEDVPVAMASFGPVPRYAVNPPVVGMDGDIEAMAMYAGQGVGSIAATEPAAEIIGRFAAALS
jgi:NAD(P)H-dependent flavin oxidoreductase YrpB (nitropropane dioxygenase family)